MMFYHEDCFIDECRFAKIVKTEKGDAILIGWHVFHVTGPNVDGLPNTPVELFSKALRRVSDVPASLDAPVSTFTSPTEAGVN